MVNSVNNCGIIISILISKKKDGLRKKIEPLSRLICNLTKIGQILGFDCQAAFKKDRQGHQESLELGDKAKIEDVQLRTFDSIA